MEHHSQHLFGKTRRRCGWRTKIGTREVYEQKLRRGNLQHDPTMYPGLGSLRCPRYLSLLDPQERKGELITPVLRDSAAVAGTGIGAMLSAIYGLNIDSSPATFFWGQFCIRRLRPSEVRSNDCDIILCDLKCFPSLGFMPHPAHGRFSYFSDEKLPK